MDQKNYKPFSADELNEPDVRTALIAVLQDNYQSDTWRKYINKHYPGTPAEHYAKWVRAGSPSFGPGNKASSVHLIKLWHIIMLPDNSGAKTGSVFHIGNGEHIPKFWLKDIDKVHDLLGRAMATKEMVETKGVMTLAEYLGVGGGE
jgi:hypothetical protein